MATNSAPERNHENEIWNPWAALWLSIIFTPVFGTMLQGTDLRHIGDEEGADAAFLWERSSMILLAIAAIIQPIASCDPDPRGSETLQAPRQCSNLKSDYFRCARSCRLDCAFLHCEDVLAADRRHSVYRLRKRMPQDD